MLTSTKQKLVQRQICKNKYKNFIQILEKLEKEQGVKKIMTKDNIELKAQNQTLRIKPLENQEKHAENFKKNCKAKEEIEKLNR